MDRQLFQKYIDDRCTPAEGRVVEQWLRSCTEQELDALLLESWEDNNDPMPAEQAHALWQTLSREILAGSRESVVGSQEPGAGSGEVAKVKRIPVKMIYRIAAAVAAAVLLAVAGIQWLRVGTEAPAAIAAHRLPAKPATVSHNDWVNIVNSESAKMTVRLDDGTQVALYRYSHLRFLRHFDTAHRDIYLEGKALFTVAKDRRRPFTVYSGDINTTALGTVFLVDAKERRPYISVRLLEGRIVVRLPKQNVRGAKDSLFLRPGDELRYHTGSRTALIQAPANNNNTITSIKDTRDTLSFTRVPLPDVFEKLMLQYHVTISYNKTAIAAMNFTGTIAPADSVAVVLKVIAQMNGLAVTETDGGFVIAPARP